MTNLKARTRVYAICCVAMSSAMANEAAFERAGMAAQSGRIAEMQIAYEAVLQESPHNIRALNGQATAMAWQANYRDAQMKYKEVLAIDSRNIGALVGLGYAYAWDGQFVNAHTQFQRALHEESKHIGARKGIAYSFHWQGENELALGAFETAASLAPNNAEIEEAMGRVNVAMGRTRDSIRHFDRALSLDPDRHSAILAKRTAYVSAPALEVSTYFGTTNNAGSGLRQFEVVHWPAAETRFAIRYDNSLGLDNPSLSDRGEDAPGYFASVQNTFRDRFTLGVEVGRRDLVDDRQTIITLQGTYFSQFGALRFGALRGRSGGNLTDNLVFGGINLPLSDRWRIEPMLHLSETGTADDQELRGTVSIDYHSEAGWQVGAFVGGGEIDATDSQFSGTTKSAGIRGNHLLAGKYTFHWSIRHDQAPTARFSVAEIGFTYRLVSN